jgi:hypothetical protein
MTKRIVLKFDSNDKKIPVSLHLFGTINQSIERMHELCSSKDNQHCNWIEYKYNRKEILHLLGMFLSIVQSLAQEVISYKGGK